MPPIVAGQTALDTHNVASAWNKALLDNSARPSGALVYAADGANMTDTQFDRLKGELPSAFQGSANAGRPILSASDTFPLIRRRNAHGRISPASAGKN